MSAAGKEPDIIRWVLDRMLAHDASITPELALTVEREARAEWGGRSIGYVAKRCAADMPNADAVLTDYARADTVDQVARRHGISRATLYRLVRKP